jgi:glucose-1-phosphate thymidylyltransferase
VIFIKAIILAAGYATRLYPITKNKPKALLNIKGRPIINYILDEIEKIKAIDEVFIVSNDKFINDFKNWEKNIKNSKKIKIINDGTTRHSNRLGAIGDIQFVIEKESIKEDIIVIAADNFFTYDLKKMYDFYVKNNKDCIVCKELKNTYSLKSFAVAVLDKNDIVIDFEEKPKIPKSNTVVYATYIYKQDTVNMFKKYLDEGNNNDAPGNFVAWLYKLKLVIAYKMEGNCYDIGTKEVYDKVKNLT